MNTLEKLTWQKKAGIISETQHREAMEALTSEQTLRQKIKEALAGMLDEKKKKSKKKEEEEEIDMDIDMDNPQEVEGEAPEGEEEMSVEEPQPTDDTAQQVEDALMTAYNAAGEMGNTKLQTQIRNTLTMLQREKLAGSEPSAL
jgi:hypothetical protein